MRMTKIVLPAVIALCVALEAPRLRAEAPVVIHFFESALCPACKRAKEFLSDYAPRNNVRVVYYEVRDKNDAITPSNRRNIGTLSAMLDRIDRSNGHRPFIHDDTMRAFPYLDVKGVPHYEKRISQSTVLKKEVPVPFFIIGERAIAGFQKNLIIRFVDQEKKR
jgi:thiol-disulfide isomerase/thioredoxin